MELKAYVTNLGKYNEGETIGEWVEFPIDEDEERELMERIGCAYEDDEGEWHNEDYEEYFMTDYESGFSIYDYVGEYVNIEDLNEYAERLENIEDEDLFRALLDDRGGLDEALNIYESSDYIWYPGMSLTDVAEELVDSGVFGDVSDSLERYIDYERMGQDLSCDGYKEYDGGVLCIY